MKGKQKILLSLVLPVYNEEKNLEKVFSEINKILKKANILYEAIFSEGGSTDNSFEVLKNLQRRYKEKVVVLKSGFGPGEKIMDGFKAAKGKYVGIISSDGQDDISSIAKCIEVLEAGKADFVKGRRINRETFKKLLVSRCYNLIANILFGGLRSMDINGHPKIFPKKILQVLDLKLKDEWIDLECLVKIKNLNLRLIEIPVREKRRESGRSTADLKSTFRFFSYVFKRYL